MYFFLALEGLMCYTCNTFNIRLFRTAASMLADLILPYSTEDSLFVHVIIRLSHCTDFGRVKTLGVFTFYVFKFDSATPMILIGGFPPNLTRVISGLYNCVLSCFNIKNVPFSVKIASLIIHIHILPYNIDIISK